MEKSDPQQITKLLEAINHGERDAWQNLFTIVYGELRKMARRKMAGESPGHTLQLTALVARQKTLGVSQSREVD